jgi:hypothetical protein
MKTNYLLLCILVILVASCTSPIKKMKQNVTEHMKTVLLVPDSYKEIKFEIKDTITAKYYKAKIDTLTRQIADMDKQVLNWDTLINMYQVLVDKSSIYTYSSNSDGLTRCKEGKETSVNLQKEFITEKDSLSKLIINKSNESIIFYNVYLVYEAKNKGGNLGISEESIFIDTTYKVYKIINLDK